MSILLREFIVNLRWYGGSYQHRKQVLIWAESESEAQSMADEYDELAGYGDSEAKVIGATGRTVGRARHRRLARSHR